ncbi:Luciferase-like, subgroup [Mycolicibacterium rhodesiae JS60]|nr:Luciferase-like, subgroup [Mycolicibacterium rhodesiae JS60]
MADTLASQTSSLMETIDDLSAYMISGRVRGSSDPTSRTSGRTPAQGIQDGVEAELIGFRRIFVSERWNLKESAVLLGAVGSRTCRIELATGLFNASARNPLHAAAFGSTMHAAFGPRFVMGLGRGDRYNLEMVGLRESTFAGLRDYVRIIHRLWRGETVSYDGPAGSYPLLALGDVHEGPNPKIWFGTFGLPRAAEVIADCMDGVLLVPNLTPDGTAAAVQRIRSACERIGRDPTTVRIAQCVVTAPELDELETLEICHARALTYLQTPSWGEALCTINGWSHETLAKIRNHPQLVALDTIADNVYHRSELVAPARGIPESWMKASCAIGTVSECVAQLKSFRDAGADEIVTYGSTPAQNAAVAAAWRAEAHCGHPSA